MKQYLVYQKFISGKRLYGKTVLLKSFDSEHEAVKYIANCYKGDMRFGLLGDYYYFMREN